VSGDVRGPDRALTILLRDPNPERVALVWDTFIHARALVLDQFAARHRMASQRMDRPRRRSPPSSWPRETLARMTIRGPGADTPEQYAARLEAVRREKERIESALAGSDAAGEVALEAPHLRIATRGRARTPARRRAGCLRVYDPRPWSRSPGPSAARWGRSVAVVAFVLASGAPPVVVRWAGRAHRPAVARGRASGAKPTAVRTAERTARIANRAGESSSAASCGIRS